ncbi:FecR family protein [Mucilaginibacter conchicola]|uniref:FecR family protein n=1 Tax=Mucilaginibacter conchicola TaxID=2303333 RepID=A0A372NXP5_9SPHI|nr:FecR family protein [Mucilaginibacter conchicola]RFZ94885.1 FecR family protein [Mucilaginibacter conchicola]
MDITKFRKKLERYLKGTANETESAIVEAWYKSYQDAEEAEIGSENKETVKNAIRQKIHKTTTTPVIKLKWRNYSVAAGLLLVSGIALFFIKNRGQATSEDIYTTLQTKAGEVKQIVLPDSSVMWVNSLSKVRIPAAFNGSIRNILLDDGEVFLKVKHNDAKPFRVNTHTLQVQVLGTSFNVKAYASIKHTSVAVATGKVAVSTAGKRLSFLTPGQELVFDEKTKAFKQNNIDISATQGWKDGETYLTQANFDELSLIVKNMFGLKLKAASKAVEQYQFTLRLKRNMPADDALKIISLIHNTHFRREGDEVVLY